MLMIVYNIHCFLVVVLAPVQSRRARDLSFLFSLHVFHCGIDSYLGHGV